MPLCIILRVEIEDFSPCGDLLARGNRGQWTLRAPALAEVLSILLKAYWSQLINPVVSQHARPRCRILMIAVLSDEWCSQARRHFGAGAERPLLPVPHPHLEN